jgi:hypothetical protein
MTHANCRSLARSLRRRRRSSPLAVGAIWPLDPLPHPPDDWTHGARHAPRAFPRRSECDRRDREKTTTKSYEGVGGWR